MEYYKEQLQILNKKVQDQSRNAMQAHSLIEDLKFENTKLKQENAMFKTNTTEFVKT
jgi:hypothetical protein